FFPGVGFFSVLPLPAVFVDAARAWKKEETLGLTDYYISVGVGIRLAFERSSKNRLLRFDAAYSEKNGWQLSIGTDQYFRLQADGLLLTTP
ncbi:MAG: hypothetical protein AB1744_08905, partial [Candidatus Zixiibacteriota bacterium]